MFIPRCSIFIPASFGVILLGKKLTHRKVLNYGKQRSDSQRNRSNYRSLFTRKGNIENLEVPVPQGVSYITLVSPSHIGSRGSGSKVLVVVYLLGCAFHIFYSHPRYPCRSAFPSRYKKAKAGIRISSFPLGAL